jgi:hypothetical protein
MGVSGVLRRISNGVLLGSAAPEYVSTVGEVFVQFVRVSKLPGLPTRTMKSLSVKSLDRFATVTSTVKPVPVLVVIIGNVAMSPPNKYWVCHPEWYGPGWTMFLETDDLEVAKLFSSVFAATLNDDEIGVAYPYV